MRDRKGRTERQYGIGNKNADELPQQNSANQRPIAVIDQGNQYGRDQRDELLRYLQHELLPEYELFGQHDGPGVFQAIQNRAPAEREHDILKSIVAVISRHGNRDQGKDRPDENTPQQIERPRRMKVVMRRIAVLDQRLRERDIRHGCQDAEDRGAQGDQAKIGMEQQPGKDDSAYGGQKIGRQSCTAEPESALQKARADVFHPHMVLYVDDFASQPPGSGRGRRTNDALMVASSLETSRQTISRLQHEIDEALAPLVPRKKCALLDFPHHPNVGDSAIWVGEHMFLSKLGVKPAYVCTAENRDWNSIERAIGDDGTIFIHGGGNFGDVWPNISNCARKVGQISGTPRAAVAANCSFQRPE